MRRLVLLVAVLVLQSGCIGVSVNKDASAARPGTAQLLSAEKAGQVDGCREFEIQEGFSRVRCELSYENDTGRRLREVAIWCRALDADGYQVGIEKVKLDSLVVGPMEPGWKVRLPVVINISSSGIARVECEVAWAR